MRFTSIARFSKKLLCPDAADLILILFALIISLIIWLPSRYDPFHWDAAGFVANAARQLIDTAFNPLISTGSDFAHPPFFIAIIAFIWQFSGSNLLWLHLINLPLLPVLIISTYYLGKKLYSPLVGFAAAFLTALTPVIVAEYGVLYIDLPTAAFLLLSLCLWYHHRPRSAMLFFTFALLTKATILAFIPFFFLTAKPRRILSLHNFQHFIPPLAVLALYLTYHYLETGWFLIRPGRRLASVLDLEFIFQSLIYVSKTVFIDQMRFILSLSAAFITIYSWSKGSLHRLFNSLLLRHLLLLCLIVLSFSLTGEFAARYAIAFYPLFYLFFAALIAQTLSLLDKPKLSLIIICLIPAALFLYSWRPSLPPTSEYEFSPPSDLTYHDMLLVFRQTAAYLEFLYPHAQIYGGFPENLYLSQPFLGYISYPLDIQLCPNFTLRSNQDQIIILHPYSPSQTDCRLLLDKVNVEPVHKLAHASKWVELYQVTSTPSAQLTD